MRRLVKHIMSVTYKPMLVKYLSKTRTYSYQGINLEIPPQVFHPGFFYSTKLLLRYLSKEQLSKKTVLELGAGSGLLSIYAAKKGAVVTATDISLVAVECIKANAEENNVNIDIIPSDLFECIPPQAFDFILINPPYYKKRPASASDYAWYCGENGAYFRKLFKGLHRYINQHSRVLMVLCDGCDLSMIREMAQRNSLVLKCVFSRNNIIEKNYIFKIQSIQ